MENLYEEYFEDAIAYFKEEYGDPKVDNKNIVFVYVSDDMKWGRRKLKKLEEQIFFVGCGDGDKTDCIGKDFGVLSSCNHTITTHGTFGHWVSLICIDIELEFYIIPSKSKNILNTNLSFEFNRQHSSQEMFMRRERYLQNMGPLFQM